MLILNSQLMKPSLIVILLLFLVYGEDPDVKIWQDGDYSIVGKVDVEDDKLTIYYNIRLLLGDSILYKDGLDFIKENSNEAKVRVHSIGNKVLIQYEVDDRPLKDKMRLVHFKNGKFEKAELLPNFFDSLSIIDMSEKTVSGYLNYSETYCLNCDTVFYNPKIVYKISIKGSIIDSLETKRINSEMYGDFYGFDYNVNIKLKKSLKP